MLNLKNIGLKFNGKWLFRNFNLDVAVNNAIALKGASGGGKSSIINLILGFYQPDEGQIFILNQELTALNCSILRQSIAYMPQNYNIIDNGTVLQTILKPFEFQLNANIKIDKDIILDEFEKLKLDKSIINNTFSSASGGEKQRIAMIITKLLNRKIILLDEPTSALDKESRTLAANYLLYLQDQCLISISHDEEWISFCSQTVDLKNEQH